MTLDTFMAGASATLEAFAAATREHAQLEPDFYLDRDEDDWWREVAAYVLYVELQDEALRNNGRA